ncbi:manganese superoxide dismutase [Morchella conica CCBAS932]|uniref:Superoxide dismutase n=1 Tax=Morchella conica CCBAS932 TaxID=1392247 RepID=A0A3N4KEX9_9PEZI|nr:manganese superoxide dismutase [Morchella conica CCBAS932]
MQTGRYTLPALPYAYDALEPYISSTIMTLHHTKHHQAYVTNLNAALSQEATDVTSQIALQAQIRFNGGGHINHSLFWKNLAPAGTGEARVEAAPRLVQAIEERFGDLGKFKERFGKTLLGLQGSGWGWLVKDAEGRLEIETTKDQDPVASGKQVILGVDMWEHAYYIQYYNNKAAYVEGIWNIINWEECEKRFLGQSALSL